MADTELREATGMIGQLLRPGVSRPLLAPETAISGKGAYVLAIALDEPHAFVITGVNVCFAPGIYAYAGSAYGPGGIRARLARHFRKHKKLHWHVDRLTVAASAMTALAVEGGNECTIVTRLSATSQFAPARNGFGSSDCGRCTTHLLQWLGQDS